MAKKSALLAALDAHKGRDYKLEKQKKLQKQAAKRKRSKAANPDAEEKENIEITAEAPAPILEPESDGWESDESEAAVPAMIDASGMLEDESYSDSSLGGQDANEYKEEEEKVEDDDDDDDDDDDEEGIPLSDIESLGSDEKADILPHQRLTINNKPALQKAYKSISLPYSTIPFSAHQTIITAAPVSIPDVNDDLNRELAFYKQCLDAANEGRATLKKEGVPFSRPNDYFAEMVKSDEHMGKIKQKMTDEAASKKASSEARRQRDLKKFGKQVQVAKLQERDKAKRDMLEKVDILKRKRKNTETAATNEEDMFDVALDDAAKEERQSKSARNGADHGRGRLGKRQKKDEKFGYGGKKRFAKSTDAASTADMRGFSAKKMKGQKQRPGKSRREKMS